MTPRQTGICRGWHVALVALVAAAGFGSPALAQAPPVTTSPLEVSVGATVNGLFNDVNSAPACVELGLPCAHEHPDQVTGYGGNASLARNLSPLVAIAGDVSIFADAWLERESPLVVHRRLTYVRSVAAGPRFSTGFFDPGTGDRSPGRFFAQVLGGIESSGVVPARPVVILGVGADVLFVGSAGGSGGASRVPGLRLAIDYRLSPGEGRNFSGWRFGVAVLIGPRV